MYFKHICPFFNLQPTGDGRIKEYVRIDGESYYDIEIRESFNANDLKRNMQFRIK